MTSKQKIEFTRNIDTLINEIEKNSPTFFDNFKRNILSKNHQLIENAIIEGGEKMYENLQNIYPNIDKLYDKVESDYLDGKIVSEDGELDRKKLENKKDEYAEILNKNMISTDQEVAEAPCSWAVVCVAYFVLAVHNTAAITVNVAAVAVAVVAVAVKVKVGKAVPEFDTASKSKNKDLLEFEILVNEIAEL